MLNLKVFMVFIDPQIKLPPFFMSLGHFTVDQMYGLDINDHCCFSFNHISLHPSADNLSVQGHILRIWDKQY